MKTTITFLIALIAFTSITQAQCFREDAFEAIDDPAQYPVAGTATLQFTTDGTKQVIFGDDFATIQGIELRVFLSSTPRLAQGGNELEVSTEPLQDDNGGTDMGDAITGEHIFDVPANVNLEDFDYIIIQCVQADVLWGRADLGANQGADCDSLGVEENALSNISIYPNPVQDEFQIQGVTGNRLEIAIFDTLGKKVMVANIAATSTLNVTSLKSGLYIMTIASEGQQISQKLIIQ